MVPTYIECRGSLQAIEYKAYIFSISSLFPEFENATLGIGPSKSFVCNMNISYNHYDLRTISWPEI